MRYPALIASATLALGTILGISAAGAADLPVKAYSKAPPLVATAYDWTGFYLGVHGGGDWFDKNWFIAVTPETCAAVCGVDVGSHTASSWLVGGQAGYNYQAGPWVLGVEAQASWTDMRASNGNLLIPTLIVNNSKTSALGTLAGRVGYAFDRFMIFGKAGGAWAHDKFWTTAGPASPAAGTVIQAADSDRFGWMLGIGAEYAFAANWSVKIEYDYMDFGRQRETLQPVQVFAGPFPYDIRQRVDLVKAGINYKFGGPVVARY